MNENKTKNKVSLQEQIDNILDNFDFERVKETMDKLDWYWGDEDNRMIPEIRDLRIEARRLLNSVKNENSGYQSSCGGFTAEKIAENGLELRFEVSTLNGFDIFDEKVEFDNK